MQTRSLQTYQCTKCNKYTNVVENRVGLDALHKCIITQGCTGTLTKVKSQSASLLDNTWTQRRVLYTHAQTIAATRWIVKHDLNSVPRVLVYHENTSNRINPSSVIVIDASTVHLLFDTAVTGVAQCIAGASAMPTVETESASVLHQVTHKGELTIATTVDDTVISLEIEYTPPGGSAVVVQYIRVDNVPSVLSPWAGVRYVVVKGKRYAVRSVNLIQAPLAPAFFNAGLVPIGSVGKIITINGQAIGNDECVILAAVSPYTSVDRVKSKIIPSTASFVYNAGEAYVGETALVSVYPRIVEI